VRLATGGGEPRDRIRQCAQARAAGDLDPSLRSELNSAREYDDMAVELVVPTVGESITEVQIGDWLVPEGQRATKEEALVVIETDKVTVELPAPISGTVTRVLKKKGETAAVGEVIGYIDEAAKGTI